MDVAQIKEIGTIVQSLGATGKESFIFYLAVKGFESVCITVTFITAFILLYKGIMRAAMWNRSEQIIMRAANITHFISPSEAEDIANIIRAHRMKN